jgi:RHS repeat-associated protein
MNDSQIRPGALWELVYDGDGNRVAETAAGVTTKYLVDTLNPTGYSQVLDELVSGAVTKTYTYGLQRISENQLSGSTWTPTFYGYDGHGNVRFTTNTAGTVGNTYQYDAFGMPIASAGTTANTYLYSGERFDSNLNLYQLRARYYNILTGRFMTMDPGKEGCCALRASQVGNIFDPATLHKYVYAANNPVNRIDPSGRDIEEDAEFEAWLTKVEPEIKHVAFDLCVEQVVENLSTQELYLGYSLIELQAIAAEECAAKLL